MTRETTETLIIGAGPSGLAVAACLAQRGAPFTQVDAASAVGSSWRGHYDRLHLHTARAHSGLPGLPFPEHLPRYPSRDQVIAYLEAYAAHHGLQPRLGVTVRRARREADAWAVETDAGGFTARHLVVATGYNAVPRRPTFPGEASFPGRVLHSRDYRTGATFRGQRAVVVGNGNSGAEIALDLWEQGASAVTLVLGGPRYVVPREVAGVSAQQVSLAYARLPRRLADAIARRTTRLALGDLRPWGFREPEAGPITEVERHGRVALIDVGTIALIKQGRIATLPGLARFEGADVVSPDGRRVPADVVVLATGYQAGLAAFLDGADAVLDDRGYPRWHGAACPPLPGLFFAGFRNPATGALRESGLEAERIAAAIAGR
ncbi:MAG: NAD(P)/FAD-dependent oxidoreductase [Myxococcales bacterium]|nr:NAD(P)/FAD-dependent oxidoreductase [Myxococcales bacterium]